MYNIALPTFFYNYGKIANSIGILLMLIILAVLSVITYFEIRKVGANVLTLLNRPDFEFDDDDKEIDYSNLSLNQDVPKEAIIPNEPPVDLKDEPKITDSIQLKGYKWTIYSDGSGHLSDDKNNTVLQFDLQTGEYSIGDTSLLLSPEENIKTVTEFKEFAENEILLDKYYNILKDIESSVLDKFLSGELVIVTDNKFSSKAFEKFIWMYNERMNCINGKYAVEQDSICDYYPIFKEKTAYYVKNHKLLPVINEELVKDLEKFNIRRDAI